MSASIQSQKRLRRMIWIVPLVLILTILTSCGGDVGKFLMPPAFEDSAADPTPEPTAIARPVTPLAGPLKPVVFYNQGSQAFTVQPWLYAPGKTASLFPFGVSTAVFPASSGSMLLPLGRYSWCYWWEIGDINNDGMMDYMHALDSRVVVLEESDSDTLDFAEKVTLSAPPGGDELAGVCGSELNISQYIAASSHLDNFHYGGSMVGLAHNTDSVTLRGPITVEYFFRHRAKDGDPMTEDPHVTVTIPAGETHLFYLEDTIGEHVGDWDLYVQVVSINNP